MRLRLIILAAPLALAACLQVGFATSNHVIQEQSLGIHYNASNDLLDYLVDRNPLKQGTLSPGVLIPIHGPEIIAETKPDYLLVLAWNFFDEIYEQQSAFRAAGGKFLVPLPVPRIVS